MHSSNVRSEANKAYKFGKYITNGVVKIQTAHFGILSEALSRLDQKRHQLQSVLFPLFSFNSASGTGIKKRGFGVLRGDQAAK